MFRKATLLASVLAAFAVPAVAEGDAAKGADLSLTAPMPDHMVRTWKMLDWHAKDAPADPFEEEL